MYQVSAFNNNVESVIHFPSASPDDPHLNKLPLTEGLSIVDGLSFSVHPNNPGYNIMFELTTIVKVIDVRDGGVRFSGRVLSVNEKMDNTGNLYKEIVCEGALSFLNDTKQRGNTFITLDVVTFLTQLLTIHNGKVAASKQIRVGNVNVTVANGLTHTCEFKTTLAELLLVREVVGGEIRVRETNGLLYLDWLTALSGNTVEVLLGTNMKDMVVSKNVTSLGTRIIPLGANNLTIASVNGGVDYIEDAAAKSIYGVIEKTVEYKDIVDPTILKNTCLSEIAKHTQPLYLLTSNALDLSFITDNKAEQFVLGTNLHLVNPIMAIDDIYTIVQINLDLLTPYNPTLTIANAPVTLTSSINDLRTSSIQNDGVYNNVQIGSSFGIRVVKSDGKVVTTLNATDGISIENQGTKVFYVDAEGNLVAVNITANNMTAVGGTFNDITVDVGTFTNITIDEGLIVKDGDTSCSINAAGIELTSASGKKANIQILDDPGFSGTYIRDDLYVEDILRVFGEAKFEKHAHFFDTVRIDGELTLTDGWPLSDYIDGRITTLVKSESLK